MPGFSSYLMAGSHGLFISLYALWLLTADDWHNFNSPNTESQNIALALSLGYFIADFIVYLAPFEPDPVFIVHHVASAAFLLASLHLNRGGSACVIGLLLGEVTSPFYHVYNCLNGLRTWHPTAENIFRWWAPLFTAFFALVRTGCGPVASYWWCNKVAVMDVPLLHRTIWIIASIGICAVSQPFTYGFVKDTYQLLMSPALHSSSPAARKRAATFEERQTRARVAAVAAAAAKDD